VFINVGVFDHRWSDQKPRSDESPLKRNSKRCANMSAEQKRDLVRTSRRDFMKLLTWNGIALSVSRLAYAETAAIVFAGDRRKAHARNGVTGAISDASCGSRCL
jgi:hypothetical protein